ncbi:sodium-dependent transporter [Rapidithrix thailandica]|uniref:Sodium-dependent transporter n=1 Tax=Rapidithrix thailandica TaxID=413964 RepID=A0AAW9S2L5_9BACT
MATRGGFSSKFGFIAAAAGSAVGLGNLWGFPFEVADGGGAAFVLIYLVCCFVLCFPVMVTEIAIGRKTGLNPVGAFKSLGYKNWNIIGKLGVLSGVLILSYYNVVAGWAFGYFLELVQGRFEIGSEFGTFTANFTKVGLYAILFMFATAFIVSKGIASGIEKAAKILMPSLIILILMLVIYAVTLEHATEGLQFYLIPDFSKINLEVVYDALGQAFFSLSLGMGALITYGSYVSKNDNIISSAALITLADIGIAFIAGLMMFPFVAYLLNGNMDQIPSGAGLIFVTLPGVFETLGPNLGVIIGAAFFLLLSFAALTSTVSLLEVPVSYLVDEHQIRRNRAVWLVALGIFLVGIPSLLANGGSDFFSQFITYFGAEKAVDFMSFLGHLANDTFLPLGGLMIVSFAAYIWKKEQLYNEIETGNSNFKGSFIEKYIGFAITYICPVILGMIFILTVLNRFFGIDLLGQFTA